MKNKKIIGAAIAATMFVSAACGLVACDKDAATDAPGVNPPNGGNNVYTVSFDANGGTLSGAATLKTNAEGIVQGTVPSATKTDATFKGWSLKDSTAVLDLKTYKFTQSISVYAVYESSQGETGVYTINFNYGDGSGSPASARTKNGKLETLPTPTPPEGKTFDNWYTEINGGGNTVTTSTVFTSNGTVYANYTGGGTEEQGDGELLVNGQRKLYLTDNSEYIVSPIVGATATYEYYATNVGLTAGDVVTFRIKDEVLAHHATPAEGARLFDTPTRHGASFDQESGSFTVKTTGLFTIYVRYYDTDSDANEGNAAHPCWSIEFTDGLEDVLVDGGAYLVGEKFDNAKWDCAVENYIDPIDGLTVTLNANTSFKIKCNGGDNNGWIYNDSKYYEGEGLNFSTVSDSGNASVLTPGTYKITVSGESSSIKFTFTKIG